ncbi:MAG: twin-arginine translocation pathway signal protein [Gammaproteobacteria bacterium]
MSKQPLTCIARRRDFLKLTVAAGSAFAVGGIADKTLAEAETKASPDASTAKPRTSAYYDKARF